MSISFPIPGWHITGVDQSIWAAATYRQSARYPTDPRSGVRVSVTAHGPRYDRFIEACHVGDDAAIDAISIHVYGVGATFDEAVADAVRQAQTIETQEPIE